MAITYVGGISAGTAGGTNPSLSLTGLTGGSGSTALEDDLVIVCYSRGSNVESTPTMNTSGYTTVATLYANDTYDSNLLVAYKVMGATPDTTAVVNTGASTEAQGTCVHVWRGVDTSGIFDVTSETATGIDTGRPTPPAITPVTSGSIIIACGGNGHASTPNAFTTSDLSNFITNLRNDTYDTSAGMGSYAWTSGEFTPAQFGGGVTDTDASWCGVTMALLPIIPNQVKSVAGISNV